MRGTIDQGEYQHRRHDARTLKKERFRTTCLAVFRQPSSGRNLLLDPLLSLLFNYYYRSTPFTNKAPDFRQDLAGFPVEGQQKCIRIMSEDNI